MRQVWLLRHAEAMPGGEVDKERPLSLRGRRDAAALGRRLSTDRLGVAEKDLPQLVLCSRAVRTRETATLALPEIPTEHPRILYGASPEQVIDELRLVDDVHSCVVVVGHNPTTLHLATILLEDPEEGPEKFHTCGVAMFEFPADSWAELTAGSGELLGRFAPPY